MTSQSFLKFILASKYGFEISVLHAFRCYRRFKHSITEIYPVKPTYERFSLPDDVTMTSLYFKRSVMHLLVVTSTVMKQFACANVKSKINSYVITGKIGSITAW